MEDNLMVLLPETYEGIEAILGGQHPMGNCAEGTHNAVMCLPGPAYNPCGNDLAHGAEA
jgi:hypothetical protein